MAVESGTAGEGLATLGGHAAFGKVQLVRQGIGLERARLREPLGGGQHHIGEADAGGDQRGKRG